MPWFRRATLTTEAYQVWLCITISGDGLAGMHVIPCDPHCYDLIAYGAHPIITTP